MLSPKLRSMFFKQSVLFAAIAACLMGAILVLHALQPAPLRMVELATYDALLPLRTRPAPSALPVVIAIDEETQETYGPWPWPRTLLARLLEAVGKQKVAAIGLDLVLSTPDNTSPASLAATLLPNRQNLELIHALNNLPDPDTILGNTIQVLPVVLGAYARVDSQPRPNTPMPPPAGFVAVGHGASPQFEKHLTEASGAYFPLPQFWHHAPVGMVNLPPDTDGVLRRIPLVTQLGEGVYATLALRTLMRALHIPNIRITMGSRGPSTLHAGPFAIPIAHDGSMLLPFQVETQNTQHISAKSLLDGTLPPETLKGRIAFVGVTTPNLPGARPILEMETPESTAVHAALLNAIVSNDFLVAAPWVPLLESVLIVLASLVGFAFFGFLRPMACAAAVILLPGIMLLGTWHFTKQGIFVSPLYTLLAFTLQGIVLGTLRYRTLASHKQAIMAALHHAVTPGALQRITRLPMPLHPKEHEVTVLYARLRGFSTLTRKLAPAQSLEVLNHFCATLNQELLAHHATLDTPIDVGLRAFWNAPLPQPGHKAHAVEATLALQQSMRALNTQLRATHGLSLHVHMGLHTTTAPVGCLFTGSRPQYTPVGHNVRLTIQLEHIAAQYGIPLVASAAAAPPPTPHLVMCPLDTLALPGSRTPVALWFPLTQEEADARKEELEAWQEALLLYKKGEFAETALRCIDLHDQHPDEALYALFADRAQKLAAAPPIYWEGVWNLYDAKPHF
ncbi:CHASE2 domain-containing protein [Desulfovibrio cuneatus]|uniref:CHASE2 domain-containing protein n=1 Tax=Desulfovibrio cuneatus TaxID=159728 RepID=UPI0003F51885|nr:adenylate/guanylate cyclase domain-containing protein [Desulfovibrio cuneatus]